MRPMLAAILVMLATPAMAQDWYLPPPMEEAPGRLLARAEQVIQLVRRDRQIVADGYERNSDLRVSLVVLNNGPSTDVSPRQDLHLALYNVINEFGTAWALVPVAAVWSFEGVERTEAGIYAVTAVMAGPGDGSEECYFPRMRITVDARQLSVDVRNAPGLGEFEERRYTTPVGLTRAIIGCGDP